ncbi:DNA-binding transcriptional regulator YiaG [Streptococcus gallinaceus]|nr:MerR family transcriptional regulator [Streptococcus gallinaceus]MCP1640399.1 DNA-binding transcriptional regulator YiaG [Streptococcus gallinaceus]MCP1771182.1 DNA-binding transcriptional regulator YiaG [Streptococcus gallinaceus]
MNNETNLIAIEKQLALIIEMIKYLDEMKPSLGIVTQKELLKQLNISPNTLKSWEKNGLNRLEPPIEGTRTVYYKLDEVLHFLTN